MGLSVYDRCGVGVAGGPVTLRRRRAGWDARCLVGQIGPIEVTSTEG